MTPLVRLWIWISAFASLAGWGLSAAGELNRKGYTICAGLAAIIFFLRRWRKHSTSNTEHRTSNEGGWIQNVGRWKLDVECSIFLKKSFRRFRRPLPLGFAALAVFIFLGGVIYAPTHWNAVTYHMPRVLQWLAAGRWHWIHTPVERMNYSGCDFEWLTAPLLLFTNSDRGLFLLNFIPFLLLPGLVFSVFTRLGVRARVAWPWMWLLPTGYIYMLQAGSAGNDAFSTVYALAAMDFGLRARASRQPRDWWLSVLAAALLTGTKPTSLPLLLPWAIVIVTSGAWRVAGKTTSSGATSAVVVAVAAVISFLPIAVMNQIHSGDWLGTSLESSHLQMENPLTGIVGNIFQLGLHNFTPPLFPLAGWWNQHCAAMLPHSWIAGFQPGFSQVGELPNEDWPGMGFGLGVLLAVSVAAAFFVRNSRRPSAFSLQPSAFVLLAPWIALLFFCAKSAMNTPARLIAPYYPLLLPLLLTGAGQSQIVRRRWWRALAGGVVVLAFAVLALSPDRPLWPARTILSGLAARHPDSHLISRALEVYTVYSKRSDPLADVRPLLPPDVKAVGFIGTADDSDISLWLPLGSRRVEHFLLSDPPEQIRRRQIEYVVVGGFNLSQSGVTLDDWLRKTGAELVASTNATLKVSEGPQAWHVVRFKP